MYLRGCVALPASEEVTLRFEEDGNLPGSDPGETEFDSPGPDERGDAGSNPAPPQLRRVAQRQSASRESGCSEMASRLFWEQVAEVRFLPPRREVSPDGTPFKYDAHETIGVSWLQLPRRGRMYRLRMLRHPGSPLMVT